MLHQIRYRFKTKPTKRAVNEARASLLVLEYCPRCGRDLDSPGCGYCRGCKWEAPVIEPLRWQDWQGSTTREAVKTGYIGHAGIVKRYARAGEVLCDIDHKAAPSCERVWRIARLMGFTPQWIRMDRTKHGWHLIVKWGRPLTPLETVAIQCVLGSDIRREAFNLARVLSGKAGMTDRWNLLFEEKIT